nr:hypothetical protein [Candidatus Sigynarchaeota archaeon]
MTYIIDKKYNASVLKDLVSRLHVPGLKALILAGNSIVTMAGLDLLPGLEILKLPDNCITRIEGIEQCAAHREIDLRGNPITNVSSLLLLKKLRRIDLNSTAIQLLPQRFYNTCKVYSEKGIELVEMIKSEIPIFKEVPKKLAGKTFKGQRARVS